MLNKIFKQRRQAMVIHLTIYSGNTDFLNRIRIHE